MKLTLPAPAKVNLMLHIIGQRPDGYHLLETVMQFVDWCDVLSFELLTSPDITFESNFQSVTAEDNLVVKAARLLQSTFNVEQGAHIVLDKQLPTGAGMGGGSSDAATTLLAMNQLWQLNLSTQALIDIGVQLGADVPIFLHGHAGWVTGIGEHIESLQLPERWFLLVMPDCHVQTANIFKEPALKRDCPSMKSQDYQFLQGENVFLPVVLQHYPAVREAAGWLGQYADVYLTGSGSVLFSVIDTAEEAGRIANLAPDGLRCVVTRGLNQSPTRAVLSR